MLRHFKSERTRWVGGAMVTAAIAIVMIARMGVQSAAAQVDGTGRPCSNMTLHGNYGLLVAGQRAVPPFLGGGVEKFVGTAMTTFDGNGRFVIQSEGAGLHGEVVGVDPNLPGDIVGIYAVNSNCTGTIQWQPPAPIPPIVQSFVIVDNGKHVKSAVMSPLQNVTTIEYVRQ